MFRIDVDGTPYLIAADEDCDCEVYAEDPTKGFISETGYRSFVASSVAPRRRETIDMTMARIIREQRDNPEDTSGKRKPRKGPLPLPKRVYRLPVSWDEDDAPIAVEPGAGPAGRVAPVRQDRNAGAAPGDDLAIPPFLKRAGAA